MEMDEQNPSDAAPRPELISCVAGLNILKKNPCFVRCRMSISSPVKQCTPSVVKNSQLEFSLMVCAYWLEHLQHVFSFKAS